MSVYGLVIQFPTDEVSCSTASCKRSKMPVTLFEYCKNYFSKLALHIKSWFLDCDLLLSKRSLMSIIVSLTKQFALDFP